MPHLERAYRIFPDAEIASHWGEVLWVNGKQSEARALWARALARAPDSKPLRDTIERLTGTKLEPPAKPKPDADAARRRTAHRVPYCNPRPPPRVVSHARASPPLVGRHGRAAVVGRLPDAAAQLRRSVPAPTLRGPSSAPHSKSSTAMA